MRDGVLDLEAVKHRDIGAGGAFAVAIAPCDVGAGQSRGDRARGTLVVVCGLTGRCDRDIRVASDAGDEIGLCVESLKNIELLIQTISSLHAPMKVCLFRISAILLPCGIVVKGSHMSFPRDFLRSPDSLIGIVCLHP